MNKPKSLTTWQLIHKSLLQNIGVMLLYVLESNGSSPGRQGFLMAVNAVGEMDGSIGGGIMEFKLVELAKEKLHDETTELSIRTQYHDKQSIKNQSGMICSGDQTILLYRVQASDVAAINTLLICLENNQNGLLQLSPSGINVTPDQRSEFDYLFDKESEQKWTYQERIGYKNQLFIVGGGHCALALSKLMSQLDFYIRVYDNRPDLHTMLLNNVAHEFIYVQTYSELAELIPSGVNHYVVVMTFGYRTDDDAIRALFNKHLRYFGVLGSQTKIKKLFSEYRVEEFSEEKLNQILAPIGLSIHSQTPEEIAVSIAAQIIQVKNTPA